jgi:hypothetical protein
MCLLVLFLKAPAQVADPYPRTYTELLDEFSLHQFFIRNGHILDTTPEFQSFHRKFQFMWSQIKNIILQVGLRVRYLCTCPGDDVWP